MKKRTALFACTMVVLAFTSVMALEIPTPNGYAPWFSYDVKQSDGDILKINAMALGVIEDWEVFQIKGVASNMKLFSVESDPSEEYLLVGPAWYNNFYDKDTESWTKQPPQWSGNLIPRETESGPFKIIFGASEGNVTHYHFFIKKRNIYGSCGKAGVPSLSME